MMPAATRSSAGRPASQGKGVHFADKKKPLLG